MAKSKTTNPSLPQSSKTEREALAFNFMNQPHGRRPFSSYGPRARKRRAEFREISAKAFAEAWGISVEEAHKRLDEARAAFAKVSPQDTQS